ncbi:FixH family protein [Pannonibacter phragmitetus]|uniref:FixH family protein n=1 Tax=Pannonibacter phragmitetus TaxID=121719 RepID=UPI003D2F0D3A
MSESASAGDRRDHWIPACFILFFVFLTGLLTWFVVLANQSFTGVVTDNAYAVGLDYNDVLAQREVEKRLGWAATLTFKQGNELGGDLAFIIRDRDGKQVVADEIRATAELMTRFPQIQPVEYVRRPDGVYEAKLSVPLAGRWFIRARVERDGQSIHVIDEVDVQP